MSSNVYIGRLSDRADPLDWGGEPRIGNIPQRIGPFFPTGSGSRRPFPSLVAKIQRGELSGKQVDWGAWAASVSKQDIVDFIVETYRDDPLYGSFDKVPGIEDVLAFIHALPDEHFALVACDL
ncbi:MAG: hypothetical protein JOZ40_04040 [Methylobacteriaceae bacterium]|nr:hypothetical protein [Methylobacteriaceae bacterium]